LETAVARDAILILFSSKWYLEQYLDVASAGLNPLVHYITAGRKNGVYPIQCSMRTSYAEKYAEARDEFEDLLQHYLTVGGKRDLSLIRNSTRSFIFAYTQTSPKQGWNR